MRILNLANVDRLNSFKYLKGVRVGGVVTLQQSPFIQAMVNGSLVAPLESNAKTIVSTSLVRLKQPDQPICYLYRYYFTDASSDGAGEFLQLSRNKDGFEEILYCVGVKRTYPETKEEQAAFMGQNDHGLGQKHYQFGREELAGMGYSEARLPGILGNAPKITYERNVGEMTQDFVRPHTGTETKYNGTFRDEQEIYAMAYTRALGADEMEHLLITTTPVLTENGIGKQSSFHVDFVVAIPLEREALTVLTQPRVDP